MKKIKFYRKPAYRNPKIVVLALSIVKQYNIKYRLRINSHENYAHPADEKIFLGIEAEDTIQDFLSAVMHEVAHVLNFRNKKYIKYHNAGKNVRITKQRIKDYKRLGIRAEVYTDSVAKKLMRKHFPEIPYRAGYTKTNRKWYKAFVLDQLIAKLKRIQMQ